MSAPLNLVNLERVHKAHGTTVLLDDVSLGVAAGERIGVVGRHGGGEKTLPRGGEPRSGAAAAAGRRRCWRCSPEGRSPPPAGSPAAPTWPSGSSTRAAR